VQAPPLVEAYRVVVEPRGTLLVADGGRGGGRIVRVDPATGRRRLVAGTGGHAFAGAGGPARRASLGRVTDVALGPGGSIYAIADRRVVRIARDGRLDVVARFDAALGLAVDRRGTIYVTDDEGGRLLRVDPRTHRTTTVARGFAQPIGVAIARDGSVLVASGHDGGRVERLAADGSRARVVDGLALAAFVTVSPDGSLLVVDHVRHDGRGRVLRVSPAGRVESLSAGRIPAPTSAAAAPDDQIYVTTFGRPALGRLDPATGKLVALGNRSLSSPTPSPR
jgi:DNA-binding beta-propeller fold protein YncE